MFLLIVVLGLSVIGIIAAEAKFNEYFLRDYKKFEQFEYNYEILTKKLKDLKIQKELLDSEYENVATLFEVTKNISKTLNREEVFTTFKQILKSLMNM